MLTYVKPNSLKEVVDYIAGAGEGCEILNGGTDLIVRMREGHSKPTTVIDIKGIDMLSKIKINEEEVLIGATVKLDELANHETIQMEFPYLAAAAGSVGSKQVRNRATCIGNICNASPLADTATPLMVLDAKVHIYGAKGERTVPIQEFFVFVRKTVLEPGEIVTGISFKRQALKGFFTKMSRRKEVDLSTVCSTVVMDKGNYRISYGAVAPTPIRLPRTEDYLAGKTLSAEVIQEACNLAKEEVKPIDDIRASKEYRLNLVEVMLRRSLEAMEKGE